MSLGKSPPTKSELDSLTHHMNQHLAGFPMCERLVAREEIDSFALDEAEEDLMVQIQQYSITCTMATGKYHCRHGHQ